MCFRPGNVESGPFPCPACGKTLQPMGGMALTKCPFCKADLTGPEAAAPSAPAAPAAPKAPSAPAAPKAPGAPKPQGQ